MRNYIALHSLFKYLQSTLQKMSFIIQNTDDISHTAVIAYLLKKISTLPSASDARVSACNELLTYVANEALQFTLHHDRFKATVINKCIEFKIEYCDNIHNTHYADLAATSTSLLALLRSATPSAPAPATAPAATVKHHTPRSSPRLANKQRLVYAL